MPDPTAEPARAVDGGRRVDPRPAGPGGWWWAAPVAAGLLLGAAGAAGVGGGRLAGYGFETAPAVAGVIGVVLVALSSVAGQWGRAPVWARALHLAAFLGLIHTAPLPFLRVPPVEADVLDHLGVASRGRTVADLAVGLWNVAWMGLVLRRLRIDEDATWLALWLFVLFGAAGTGRPSGSAIGLVVALPVVALLVGRARVEPSRPVGTTAVAAAVVLALGQGGASLGAVFDRGNPVLVSASEVVLGLLLGGLAVFGALAVRHRPPPLDVLWLALVPVAWAAAAAAAGADGPPGLVAGPFLALLAAGALEPGPSGPWRYAPQAAVLGLALPLFLVAA